MNIILGGGIAGISTAYHLNIAGRKYKLFEKNASWGGLCDNFIINGFLFDYFVHLSFTTNEYVKDIFSQSTKFYSHIPVAYNYYKATWLKHPVQNNLFPLPVQEKINIIEDFVNRPIITPSNYYEWLLAQFGKYFTDNFPCKYTKKYWTEDPFVMEFDWVNIINEGKDNINRFSLPSLREVLRGAFEILEDNFYYATEMRYPEQGGYKAFLNSMVEDIFIQCKKQAICIDIKNQYVEFMDGTKEYYENLFSSIPLPDLLSIIKDCPIAVRDAADKLLATSGQLISIGFNRPDVPKYLWTYIYDEDIFPARIYSPSLKSSNNVPVGKSSLQFETYFSKRNPSKIMGEQLQEHIISAGEKMKLFSKADIEVLDYREVKYANVVFNHERKNTLKIIHEYLDTWEVKYIGRFGKWDYLWSDQSLLSGKKAVDEFTYIY